MESWNAATWAKIASHAALVATHLKELESASSSQSLQTEQRLDHDYRMSLSGLVSAAPSNMRACFENTFGNIPDLVRVDGASSTAPVIQNSASSVPQGHCAPRSKPAGNARRGANDRIDRLRQYDRVKKREQRDKHCELVRKVYVLTESVQLHVLCCLDAEHRPLASVALAAYPRRR